MKKNVAFQDTLALDTYIIPTDLLQIVAIMRQDNLAYT